MFIKSLKDIKIDMIFQKQIKTLSDCLNNFNPISVMFQII